MNIDIVEVPHETGAVRFGIQGKATQWRIDTLFTKEPDTIEWIASMDPGDVFVDIGANVGIYSIWAAKTRGAQVFAFEPESQNFAMLNVNIAINRLDVVAYPFALSDEIAIGPLFLAQFGPGGSCHTFGEQIDYQGRPSTPVHSQGSVAFPLDHLVKLGVVPWPDFIKIDVDGLEPRVFRGAQAAMGRAKSVLIEINTNLPEHMLIVADMERADFRFDPEQVEKARRTEGAFKGVGNYVFRR